MTISLSVGIPFLNAERTLGDAIRSVLAQTHSKWELLLVDDGSTDGSRALAESVCDPRIRVISDGVHRGLVYRLNQIAQLASCSLVCRLDADDMMHPRRLEQQLRAFTDTSRADVVGSLAYSLDERGVVRGILGQGIAPSERTACLHRATFVHPTIMARRDWMLANPYASEFIRAEDRELWCRTAPFSSFMVLQTPLLYYREPGRVPLRGYRQSASTSRRIIARYGPSRLGRTTTALLIARSVVREAAYVAGDRLGFSKHLVASRSRALSAEDILSATSGLTEIARTPLPGVN